MLGFWLFALLLITSALLFILPALWRRNEASLPTTDGRHNIESAHLRQQELENQLDIGVLTGQQFDQQFRELQLLLADDLATDSAA